MTRTHFASRIIHATPETIYQTLLDPEAVKVWRPPEGMTAEIYEFKARPGGPFRMAFIYTNSKPGTRAKTTENADIFHRTFLELVPNEKVVELVKFESDDPGYAKPMTVTTTLTPGTAGTMVTITCDNVPKGISEADHEIGMNSTLENLARFTQKEHL